MKRKPRKTVVCDVCGRAGARKRRVSETHGRGRHLLVIENIPMVICPSCGEAYFTVETLREIERLKRYRRELAVARQVEVVALR